MKKVFLLGLPLIATGVILFLLAGGSEVPTFLGFTCIVTGFVVLLLSLWKKVFKKIWLWLPATVISGILALVVSILVFVVFFFPNETARKALQEQMAIELGRPVSIGSLHVSLLDGIQLYNLKIMDRDRKRPFIQARSLVLSYKLLPVLAGKIMVSKVVLREPQISIRRFRRNGKTIMNVDDLLGTTTTALAVASPEPTGSPAPALPFSVHISKMGLEGGSIRIDDTAARNLKSSYRLDKLDIVIEDFNWPATSPLAIRFNFRIAMDEINAAGKKTGKTFSTTQGFRGKVTLIKGGGLKPEGNIVFYARDGIFTGQQLLNAGNSFLANLKKNFFRGIRKEALRQIDYFEKLLNDRMRKVSAGSRNKIRELAGIAEKDRRSTDSTLLGKRKTALEGFEKRAKKLTDTVNKEADSLIRSVNKTYKEVTRIYPGAGRKLKVGKYITRARNFSARANKSARSTVSANRNRITGGIDILRKQAAAAFDRYIKGLTERFRTFLAGYSRKLKKGFKRELAKLEKDASKYNMNIPFMKKNFGFNKAQSTMELKNGRLYFTAFRFESKEYVLIADGWYALLGEGYNMKLTFRLPRRYGKHELLSLFRDREGRVALTVALASDGKKTRFKLQGKTVGARMVRNAKKKAREFILGYVNRKVGNRGLAAAFGGSGKPSSVAYAAQADGITRSGNSALNIAESGWKGRIAAEKRKIRSDMKKEVKKILSRKTGGLLKGLKKKKFW